MAFELRVPRQGWSMEEGTFLGWLKADGDAVREGEALFSIEGDKAQQDVEALAEGLLHIAPGGPSPGAKVKVGALLGFILQHGEAPPVATAPPPAIGGETEPPAPSMRAASGPPPAAPARDRPAASPRARRKARELGLDWTVIHGTGRGGRIVERDVISAQRQGR